MPPKVTLPGKKPAKRPIQQPSNPVEEMILGNTITEQEHSTESSTNDINESQKNVPEKEENESPKRGRPHKTTETKKQYSIAIKPSIYEKAKQKAIEKDSSVNEIISEALIKYLK